jgi:hypothetical protein
MPMGETSSETWVGHVSEGLSLVVAAAGLSLVLYGLLERHEHLSDFVLFWLLSGGTTPFKRSPTPFRLSRIMDAIGVGAGVLSLLIGFFALRPMVFVGITLCLSAWGSSVDQQSAQRGTRPAWRLLLSLAALASISLWLWYVTRPVL